MGSELTVVLKELCKGKYDKTHLNKKIFYIIKSKKELKREKIVFPKKPKIKPTAGLVFSSLPIYYKILLLVLSTSDLLSDILIILLYNSWSRWLSISLIIIMKLALICAKITVIFLCFVFVDFLDSIAVLYKYIKLHIHFICFHNLYFNSY